MVLNVGDVIEVQQETSERTLLAKSKGVLFECSKERLVFDINLDSELQLTSTSGLSTTLATATYVDIPGTSLVANINVHKRIAGACKKRTSVGGKRQLLRKQTGSLNKEAAKPTPKKRRSGAAEETPEKPSDAKRAKKKYTAV